ncbi:MAG: bifunctional methylenetetrahydrofolate dehydrogenase/methenyltetrahydrofolate cyclohydrolase FolD [Candidatus Hydrogenedentota bacterium]
MATKKQARILDGKAIAQTIRNEVKDEVSALGQRKVTPGLAVVLVGDNPASQVYIRMKRKACAEAGIESFEHRLDESTTERKLLNLVDKLNGDPKVHGILVQLPLPDHIAEDRILTAISPEKDVDGFHPVNMGRLLAGTEGLRPCTPYGCQELLRRSGYKTEGKHVVIVGRSNIVGKPLAAMLMQKAEGANATVTVCHSRTKKITSITQEADIVVAAIGQAGFVKSRMVREGAVVLDVGINRVDDPAAAKGYRLVGDVDFASVSKKAKAITPVPGGIGPMTVAMLLKNTVKAATPQS